MGGAGKTTLLRHLGWWWQRTGFVDQVFYFGYDQQRLDARSRSWTTSAASCWARSTTCAASSRSARKRSRALLAERLRAAQRHLLILDNLESITGARAGHPAHAARGRAGSACTASSSPWPAASTLVLLGSRGGEEWLAAGTFGDNVYALPGLDPEAASELADLILERHKVTQYRSDPDFAQLLKLLDGYPLAAGDRAGQPGQRQTPSGGRSPALVSGAPGSTARRDRPDQPDTSSKTESLLACIDYSTATCAEDSQQLLLCLAPFTGRGLSGRGWSSTPSS